VAGGGKHLVGADLEYVQKLIQARLITSPVLELGTGYGGATCRDLVKSNGLSYYGTDVAAGDGVDFVANFERLEDLAVFQTIAPFGSVFVLNVLEHTFDPIRILDNARTLIRQGGTLVVLTPAVWPLHNYPLDAWRILPNFYEEYARRKGIRLIDDYFEYVGFGAVQAFRNSDSTFRFPPPCRSNVRYGYGRAIHKALNTFGRAMFQPSHIAVGAVFVIPETTLAN
jgi:SAM-dependent methyltransferase